MAVSMVAICLVVIGLLWSCSTIQGQTANTFTQERLFVIPNNNGVIKFAVNGSYAQAVLENNTWIFNDLRLANSPITLPLFRASVQNCNITIRSYGRFTSIENAGVLRYNVTGQGTQAFNFNVSLNNKEWSTVVDNQYISEGKGWNLSPDGTVTVTQPATNVTIYYIGYPEDVGNNGSFSIYQRHSTAIMTAAIVAVVVVIAVIIKIKSKSTNLAEGSK